LILHKERQKYELSDALRRVRRVLAESFGAWRRRHDGCVSKGHQTYHPKSLVHVTLGLARHFAELTSRLYRFSPLNITEYRSSCFPSDSEPKEFVMTSQIMSVQHLSQTITHLAGSTQNRCLLRIQGSAEHSKLLRSAHRTPLVSFCVVPEARLTMRKKNLGKTVMSLISRSGKTQSSSLIFHCTMCKGLNKILKLQEGKYRNVKRQVTIFMSSYKTID
jgi:hypothetical protein